MKRTVTWLFVIGCEDKLPTCIYPELFVWYPQASLMWCHAQDIQTIVQSHILNLFGFPEKKQDVSICTQNFFARYYYNNFNFRELWTKTIECCSIWPPSLIELHSIDNENFWLKNISVKSCQIWFFEKTRLYATMYAFVQ